MTTARLFKHLHLFFTIFWMVMVPVSMYTGLDRLVRFVTFLSLWALVVTHWGAWQGSRAEVKVEETGGVEGEKVTVNKAEHVERH